MLTIFTPLIIALISFLKGRYIGKYGLFTIVIIFYTFIILTSLILFYNVILFNKIYSCHIYTLLNYHTLIISFDILIDTLSIIMILMIIIIAFIIHLYSFYYMKNDPHIIRFIGYLSLFTFTMLILVSASNLIQLFIGWEGVGLCSFLLINFWFTRIDATKAAIKAIIVNRLSDCFLLSIIVILLCTIGDTNFLTLFTLVASNNYYINILFSNSLFITCILLSVIAKSAQIGLHTWLPSAMEGPTPVSALIHAATMVTAGIFLLIRLSPLLFISYNTYLLNLCSIIGLLTILFSSLIAIINRDIKKIIAYSTCSQLGYMFIILSTQYVLISFFHLIMHAFFKALLFLTAGVIIHKFLDEQQLTKISSIQLLSPLSLYNILIASFSLSGLFMLAGYYSKEALLNGFIITNSTSLLIYYFLIISLVFTVLYSINLLYLSTFNLPRLNKLSTVNIIKNELLNYKTLVILSILSIISGLLFSKLFFTNDYTINSILSANSYELHNLLYNNRSIDLINHSIYKSYYYLSILPLIVILYVILHCAGITWYNNNLLKHDSKKNFFIIYLLNLCGFDLLYNKISQQTITYSIKIYNSIDKGILEYIGPIFINKTISKISFYVKSFHTGLFNLNLMFILCNVLFLIFCLLYL